MWAFTSGQPWLVNALAYEFCFEMKEGRNRASPESGNEPQPNPLRPFPAGASL
ncbi:MAG: hypothetical protein V1844_15500 [Pseudomonadota bacterium]